MDFLIGNNKIISGLFLVVSLISNSIYAQPISLNVKKIDSLKSITVNSIIIDNENNKWIGTNRGLYKINSVDSIMNHYSQENSNLPSDYLYSLYAIDNSLWIGTYNKGLVKGDMNGNFKQYLFETEKQPLVNDIISQKNKIIISTSELGVFSFYPNKSRTPKALYNTDNSELLSDNVYSLFQDKQNQLWVGTSKGLILLYNHINIFSNSELGQVAALCEYNNTLWLGVNGTSNIEIYYIDLITNKYKIKSFNNSEIINSKVANQLYSDTIHNCIWISSNKLICVFDDKVRAISKIDGLETKMVNCVAVDKLGVVWIGTSDNGLYYIENFPENTSNIKIERDVPYVFDNIVIEKGVSFDVDIPFAPNDYIVIDEAKPILNDLVKFMKLHPEIKIQINGHTEWGRGKRYLKNLSKNRAKTVANYLASNNIKKDRIVKVKGYGAKYSASYMNNMRVEILIKETK